MKTQIILLALLGLWAVSAVPIPHAMGDAIEFDTEFADDECDDVDAMPAEMEEFATIAKDYEGQSEDCESETEAEQYYDDDEEDYAPYADLDSQAAMFSENEDAYISTEIEEETESESYAEDECEDDYSGSQTEAPATVDPCANGACDPEPTPADLGGECDTEEEYEDFSRGDDYDDILEDNSFDVLIKAEEAQAPLDDVIVMNEMYVEESDECEEYQI